MAKFIVGLLLGIVIVPAGASFYFHSGRAPVATSAPSMPFEKRLARAALHARLKKEMPKGTPIPADEINLAAGARVYLRHCAFCHGLPDLPATSAAQGMFPDPPQLLGKDDVTDDPVGEPFWIVTNGIRLTGMPGYSTTLTETERWQVSQLLVHAHDLPAAATAELKPVPAGP